MIGSVLLHKQIDSERLSKKDGIAICERWLLAFARNVKKQTGKYQLGNYKWEAYWSNVEPAITGLEALTAYQSSKQEEFYAMDESGREVYLCNASEWPNFLQDSIDVYITPKSMSWSMAFSHEETCHFAIPHE